MVNKSTFNLSSNYPSRSRLVSSNIGDYILLNDIKQLSTTKKALWSLESKKYTFLVAPWISKPLIKLIVEKFFNVRIIKINTSNLPLHKKYVGKSIGFKTRLKKAIVTLDQNDEIALFSDI